MNSKATPVLWQNLQWTGVCVFTARFQVLVMEPFKGGNLANLPQKAASLLKDAILQEHFIHQRKNDEHPVNMPDARFINAMHGYSAHNCALP